VGNIKNCFQTSDRTSDTDFWQSFDRTDTGACVALQSLPIGSMDTNTTSYNLRYDTGPVFFSCKSLQYFACEINTEISDIIDETKLQVKLLINQINKQLN